MKPILKLTIGSLVALGLLNAGTLLASAALAAPFQSTVKSHEMEDEEAGVKGQQKMTKPAAKVSPVQAMKSAEGKTGGKAVLAVFEFDEGHWGYGVIVNKNHRLVEVDVDPMTGKAGDTESVTPADEAKEFEAALIKLAK